MTRKNPYFLIGTLGMLMTSIFNILLETIVAEGSFISSFSLLYPVFIAFLLVGAGNMVRHQHRSHQIN
ncbi:hypothetical protein V6B16_14270 [Salinimicrobium catena]|uniref:hypothetical protein n=1 Tax=Salinimicrobium catena TaxID=390640 RepID=UPI002FE459ED